MNSESPNEFLGRYILDSQHNLDPLLRPRLRLRHSVLLIGYFQMVPRVDDNVFENNLKTLQYTRKATNWWCDFVII